MAVRRAIARWLVRGVVRPGMSPRRSLAARRRRVDLAGRLLPLPRGVRCQPAGAENPGGEWLLPAGATPDARHGALLYVHGGAFMLGSPASHRGIAARLARLTGVPVLAVALHALGAGLPRPVGMALFSPLLDLAGAAAAPPETADLMLPPGLVAEGIAAWRGRLPRAVVEAGGQVRLEARPGLWHAWPLFAGLLPEADATLRNAAAVLAPAHGRGVHGVVA